MGNFLYSQCISKDIELIFTNNQIMVLASYLNDENERTIVAHNIFRNSSDKVAKAVVDYYLNEENKDYNLGIIKKFINEFLNLESYLIDELVIGKEKEQRNIEKGVNENVPPKKEEPNNNVKKNISLIEMEIQTITQKSFKEGNRKIDSNVLTKLTPDDILELDIIVKPLDT